MLRQILYSVYWYHLSGSKYSIIARITDNPFKKQLYTKTKTPQAGLELSATTLIVCGTMCYFR